MSNGSTGAKSKRKSGKCYNCHRFGHWAYECKSGPQKQQYGSGGKVNHVSVVAAQATAGAPGQSATEENLNAINIVAVQDGGRVGRGYIDSFATCVSSLLATNEPMMTKVRLEGVGLATFECDTAASHSVISTDVFDKLQQRVKHKLHVKPENVSIRLADGTLSNKSRGSVQLSVQKLDRDSEVSRITFFVLTGPICLLGRFALEQLWPAEYLALRKVTSASISTASIGPVNDPGVGLPQNGTPMAANEVDNSSDPASISTASIGPVDDPGVGLPQSGKPMAANEVDNSSDPQEACQPCVKASQEVSGTLQRRPGEHSAVPIKGKGGGRRNSQRRASQVPSSHPQSVHDEPEGARMSVGSASGARMSVGSASPVSPLTSPPPPPPTGAALPEKRKLPPFPEGDMTQQEGEAFCRLICETYPEVFDGQKGLFRGAEATMFVKEGHLDQLKKTGVRPAAKIPYGLEDQYEKALDELYEDCVPVDGHELITASQVVPVCQVKDGKKVLKRLAINYKSTVNEHLQDMPHVFTTCTEELDKLKGEYRSCIDLKGAFKQMPITPGFSQKILAIVSPRGYAVPTRMQFGIKTAPAIWNSNMQKLIHGMNGRGPVKAAVMVDDVCVTGSSPQEHFENLHEFVYRLYAAGLKANISKCKLYQDEVKFLGKIVDRNGVRLDTCTTDAIVKMPRPQDKQQLRSLLGHMSYISKHVPDLRKARASLDNLLKPDVKFVWEAQHQDAFNQCKRLAGNSAMLTHFDTQKPIVLTTDASPYGVGACLSHKVTSNGKSRLHPVAYASASLKPSEKNYAQIDREGLAIYWAIQHFRQYLWCQEFELHTDCSALVKIFGPKNDLGGCATGRLNRWAAALMKYNFTV